MTPEQLARVLTAGQQHVHDPYTRSALNAMIHECQNIEDEQNVRLVYGVPDATREDIELLRAQADAAPAVLDELAAKLAPQQEHYNPVTDDPPPTPEDHMSGQYAERPKTASWPEQPNVYRGNRSVTATFDNEDEAKHFEAWLRAGDWTSFNRWERVSADTAPQPVLDDQVEAARLGAEHAAAGRQAKMDEFLRENIRRTHPDLLKPDEALKDTTPIEVDAGLVKIVDGPMPADPKDHPVNTFYTQLSDGSTPGQPPSDVYYEGHLVPTELKQPAMDAGFPPDTPTTPFARGLPDEPMEPAQLIAPHPFEEHPDDRYFCKHCGSSHYAAQHYPPDLG